MMICDIVHLIKINTLCPPPSLSLSLSPSLPPSLFRVKMVLMVRRADLAQPEHTEYKDRVDLKEERVLVGKV